MSHRSPPDPAVAAALGPDYRLLDWLGSGGMGDVYLAEQVRVGNRKVALKVLHRRFSEDAEFLGRFENEAASTGRINHPNVITIYESKQAPDGTLYIAMEFVEGESLTERLRREGRLAVPEVVEITAQCCRGLAAAHRLGIVHRDVKPDNIMLGRDADGGLLVKILDFGIAKLKDAGTHTVTGNVLGTPAYMSYEQASGLSSGELDGRADLYALGLVAYHMLVGHPPFRADTPVGYITKHLSEAPPSIRAGRPDVPAGIETAVMKVLEKDRDRRYQSAAEFAQALRAAAAPTPELAAEPAVPPSAPSEPSAATDAAPTTAVPPWKARRVHEGERAGSPTPPPVRVAHAEEAPVPPPTERVTAAGRGPGGPPSSRIAVTPTPPRGWAPEPSPSSWASPRRRRRADEGGDAVAAALAVAAGVLRVAAAWGLAAYATLGLVLFGAQVLAPLVDPATIASVEGGVRPLLGPVARWVPPLAVAGVELRLVVVAVVLLTLRPRLVAGLGRLEERYRARAAAATAE